MKRFLYPLEQVVHVKKNEKIAAQTTLAQHIQQLTIVQQQLEQLRTVAQQVDARLTDELSHTVCVADMQHIYAHQAYVQQQVTRSMQTQKTVQAQVEQQQEEVTKKTLVEKIWLKAKQRAQQTHDKEMWQQEQQWLDEQATVRTHFYS